MLANCLLFTFGIAIPKLPNAWEFGSNLAGASDPTQLPPPGWPTACPEGEVPQAQDNSSGHQGPTGRPIDRPRLWGSLGPIAGIELSEGHRRPLLLSVTQGYGTPGKLDCAITIRCLPRQSRAGASDPGHPEDPMQIRNRLRTCSYPARALPVLLIPPPGEPTACPEGDAVHRPRSAKAAPGASRTVLGLAPAPGGPGTHWGNTTTTGRQTVPQQFPALPCIGSLTALEILPNPQSSALL